jgi:hypothetical protein
MHKKKKSLCFDGDKNNKMKTLLFVWQWFVKRSHGLLNSSINPITNPNPVYSHSIARHYYKLFEGWLA